MTAPTHFLAGLIVGELTGNYPAAIAGSFLIDSDHLLSYYWHGILRNPKALLQAFMDDKDPWDDQRNYLHSVFAWGYLSLLWSIVHLSSGLIFSLSYFVHLTLDALENSVFYPFYPNKTIVLQGPITYFSKQEFILDIALLFIFIYMIL